MKNEMKRLVPFVGLLLATAMIASGCSNSSSNMDEDQYKAAAAGHALSASQQAQINAAIAQQQAHVASVESKTAPPAPPPAGQRPPTQ